MTPFCSVNSITGALGFIKLQFFKSLKGVLLVKPKYLGLASG